MFRGSKKKVSQLNKTRLLKTKHLKQKQKNNLRYGVGDEEFLEMEENGEASREKRRVDEALMRVTFNTQSRAKSQFQIIKSSPLKNWKR